MPNRLRARGLAHLEGESGVTSKELEIRDWLIQRVNSLTGISPESIDVLRPIRNFGLDSLALARLTFALEEWQGFRFREYPLEEYPTIDELCRHVAEEVARCK